MKTQEGNYVLFVGSAPAAKMYDGWSPQREHFVGGHYAEVVTAEPTLRRGTEAYEAVSQALSAFIEHECHDHSDNCQ